MPSGGLFFSRPDFQKGRVSVADAPAHPDSRRLLEYWQQCEAKGGIVVGRDIPSRAIANLTSSLQVVEPIDGGRDFRIRLAPSGLLRRFGSDVTGKTMSELFDDQQFARYADGLRQILRTRQPTTLDIRVLENGHETMHIETIGLPVKSPDGKSDWILAGTFYFG
jgi:hypothetical protein